MGFTVLFIGLVLGFGLGILLMAYKNRRQEENQRYQLERLDLEDQVHESGFIDIPMGMVISPDYQDKKSLGNLKRKIERFKLRNRFYK